MELPNIEAWKSQVKDWIKEQSKTHNFESIKKCLVDYGYPPLTVVDIIEEVRDECDPIGKLKDIITQIQDELKEVRDIQYKEKQLLNDNIAELRKDTMFLIKTLGQQVNEALFDLNKRTLKVWKYRRDKLVLVDGGG